MKLTRAKVNKGRKVRKGNFFFFFFLSAWLENLNLKKLNEFGCYDHAESSFCAVDPAELWWTNRTQSKPPSFIHLCFCGSKPFYMLYDGEESGNSLHDWCCLKLETAFLRFFFSFLFFKKKHMNTGELHRLTQATVLLIGSVRLLSDLWPVSVWLTIGDAAPHTHWLKVYPSSVIGSCGSWTTCLKGNQSAIKSLEQNNLKTWMCKWKEKWGSSVPVAYK